MTEEQFVKNFGKEYLALLQEAEQYQLFVNEKQFGKFYRLMKFFKEYISENSGKIVEVNIDPKEIHSGITANFVVLDLYGNSLIEFCKALEGCSAVSFDATKNHQVCVSVTIPDVFEKR